MAPRSERGPCQPNHPASQLGTSWAQLCPVLWACFPLGLQIWPHGRTWTSEDIPRELEFSPASFKVAQVAVTNSCPFVCQNLSLGFFIVKPPLNFIFISLVKESSTCSAELASGLHPHCLQPRWSLLCLQGMEPCRTKGSGCCVFSAFIGRDFRNSGRGVTLI